MTQEIEIKVADGVQVIRFLRADKKNAFTGPMYNAMSEALDAAEKNDAIAVTVFIGSGGVFSAGNDINDFLRRAAAASSGDGKGIPAPSLDFIRRLPKVTKPMIAAVDGLAIGVGTTMLLHCDLVYATPAASLRTPFLDLGLIQEAGSTITAPARMGYPRAFEMICLGEPFAAERALQAGLINAVVPADQLEATALKAARRLAAKPREALHDLAPPAAPATSAQISAMIEEEASNYIKLMALARGQGSLHRLPGEAPAGLRQGPAEGRLSVRQKGRVEFAHDHAPCLTPARRTAAAPGCALLAARRCWPGAAAAAGAAQANWLSKIVGAAEHAAAARRAGKGAGASTTPPPTSRRCPTRPDGIALAAQATQEGHWRFVNKAGETFTAGTPEELKRVASRAAARGQGRRQARRSTSREDTVFQHRAALKDLPKGTELFVVIGDESYRILRRGDGAGRAAVRARCGRACSSSWPTASAFDEARVAADASARQGQRARAGAGAGRSARRLASTPRIDPATKRAARRHDRPGEPAGGDGLGARPDRAGHRPRRWPAALRASRRAGRRRACWCATSFKAAEEADVNLVVLQSASTPRQPGGRNWFWQKVEVKGLDEALQRARMADFLNALAGPSRRFAVSATPSGTLRTALDIRPAPDLPGGPAVQSRSAISSPTSSPTSPAAC